VEMNSSMLDAEYDRKIKSGCSGTLLGPDPVKKQYLWENIKVRVCDYKVGSDTVGGGLECATEDRLPLKNLYCRVLQAPAVYLCASDHGCAESRFAHLESFFGQRLVVVFVVVIVGWGSGATLFCMFVIVWEVSEEGARRRTVRRVSCTKPLHSVAPGHNPARLPVFFRDCTGHGGQRAAYGPWVGPSR
jgi:hypothetical protein